MGTIQVNFSNAEQFRKLVFFLEKLKVEFKITPTDDEFSAELDADSDIHDAYKASQKALADDWNAPENDHWDNL